MTASRFIFSVAISVFLMLQKQTSLIPVNHVVLSNRQSPSTTSLGRTAILQDN